MIQYPISVDQAAKYLQIGRKLVYFLILTGKIQAKKDKNQWKIENLPVQSKPLTIDAIAKTHAVSTRWIRKMIADRRIIAQRIGRKKWIIDRSEAIKMLANANFLQ